MPGKGLELRCCAKSDRCFIEIKGAEYFEADKRLKRMRKQSRGQVDRAQVEAYCKKIREERNRALWYVEIFPKDIPEGAHIRPLYTTPVPMPATPEQYELLLRRLAKKGW